MTTCPLCAHPRALGLFWKTGVPFHACRRCGVVTRGGPPEADTYDDYFPDLTHALPPLTRRRYEDLLRSLARYRETGRFLDVGCGGGFLVEAARDLGWRAEGVEPSRPAVAFGRSLGLDLHLGTLDDHAFDAGAYDLITMMEVIEHVGDPVSLVRGAARLLRPGGALYLTTPNWGSFSRRFLGKRWFPIAREHLVLFDPATIRDALRRGGLEPIGVGSANVQPHELLARFRPPSGTGSAPRCMARTMEVRETIEARPALRVAKRLVNRVLGAAGLGDTLRALAERRA